MQGSQANNIQIEEEKTDEENEDKVEAADHIGDAEGEAAAAVNGKTHNRQEIVLEYEFYICIMFEIIQWMF